MKNHKEYIINGKRYRKIIKPSKIAIYCLFFILGIITTLTIQDYQNNVQEHTTPTGASYTCRGTLIKACYGTEMPE